MQSGCILHCFLQIQSVWKIPDPGLQVREGACARLGLDGTPLMECVKVSNSSTLASFLYINIKVGIDGGDYTMFL